MGQLDGKTAFVTGGTSGIGLATAQRMAAEGAHVFLTGRTQQTIDAAVASIGDAATGVRSDITEQADLDTLAEAITARGRGLDIVFANAGGGEFATLAGRDAGTLGRHSTERRRHGLHGPNHAAAAQPAARRSCWPARPPRPAARRHSAPMRRRSGHPVIRADLGRPNSGPPDQGQHRCPRAGRNTRAQGVWRPVGRNRPCSTDRPPRSRWAAWAAPTSSPPRWCSSRSDQSSFMTGSELFVDGGAEQVSTRVAAGCPRAECSRRRWQDVGQVGFLLGPDVGEKICRTQATWRGAAAFTVVPAGRRQHRVGGTPIGLGRNTLYQIPFRHPLQ